MSYKERFDKRLNKYGQDIILHTETPGTRCPGVDNSTGYCDPQYHRDNPNELQCNDEGYVNASIKDKSIKAFIQSHQSIAQKYPELYVSIIGTIKKDSFAYIGSADIDVRDLKDTDYILYENNKYKVTNPDEAKIGNETVYYFAILELI